MSHSPIILAGMHRSGTSLVASMLEHLGFDMGRPVQAADRHNRHGYHEDIDFVRLHRDIFRDAVPVDDGGWPDWGWTEHERFDCRKSARFRSRARRLVELRKRPSGPWGWKDPRTTLLLDFWLDMVPDARFLLVFRCPREVADSIQRLEAGTFLRNPEYGYAIWRYYNQRILDFHRRNPDRCILLSSDALIRRPEALPEMLKSKWGIRSSPADLSSLADPDLFVSIPPQDPLVSLVSAVLPDCMGLHTALNDEADLGLPGAETSAPPLRFVDSARPASTTIVIPCYNDGQFLPQSIGSVERSAPEDCELIIVNDGSTQPRTLEILSTLANLGYRIIHHPRNRGLSAARNTGINAARGNYILPLDADNRILPGYIEQAAAIFASHPAAGIVYSDRELVGMRHKVMPVPEFDLQTLLKENYIDACAVFRKQVWLQGEGYDEALTAFEDWDFWLGAATQGWEFHHLQGVFFQYQIRPDSMLARCSRNPWRMARIFNYIISNYSYQYRGYRSRASFKYLIYMDIVVAVFRSIARSIWRGRRFSRIRLFMTRLDRLLGRRKSS